jgi:2-polyprenyl-3-methyl-5-hydroxy-6-metoxy-1,4-benzoquinol methylase
MKKDTSAAHFFNEFSRTFDTFYGGQRSLPMQWIDRHFRSDMYVRFGKTFEALDNLEGRSVLDIGCGSGVYSVEALRRGASKVTALDPAPDMLKLVRERMEKAGLAGRCEIVEGLFPQAMPPPHDFAIVMGVMDYVEDPVAFLGALRSTAKTSAAVSFPSRHWFRTPIRKVRYTLRKCPVYFYDERRIELLCSSAGFSRIDIFKIPGAGMDYHVCLKP